jgi:uridine kinase
MNKTNNIDKQIPIENQEVLKLIQSKYLDVLNSKSKNYIVVSICGIPGSGKTTFTKHLIDELNKKFIKAVSIPIDGYHIPLNELSKEMIYSRGCVQTFDLKSFRNDLQKLIENNKGFFPSFEHEKKDPVFDDIEINLNTIGVLIIEGIYIYLQDLKVNDFYDLRFFLDSNIDKSMERTALRNFTAGISGSIEASFKRVNEVDRINAEYLINNSNFINCYRVKYLD